MPIKIIIIILENMECEQKNLKWCDPYAVENKTVLHETKGFWSSSLLWVKKGKEDGGISLRK